MIYRDHFVVDEYGDYVFDGEQMIKITEPIIEANLSCDVPVDLLVEIKLNCNEVVQIED